MKIGEQVQLIKGPETKAAIVAGVRDLDGHRGKDSEPLLHLVTIDAADDSKKYPPHGNPSDRVEIHQDVAHASHEWTPEQKGPRGIATQQYGGRAYPGPRWRAIGE